MTQVKWSLKKVCVLQISVRKHRPPRKEEWTEYGVIKVGTVDDWDELSLEKMPKRRKKNLTLMCFMEALFPKIVEGEVYSFSGIISFGFGSTFLCVEKAYDMLGLEVGTGYSYGEIKDSLPEEE